MPGRTNANCDECLNDIIWLKCPKNISVQRDILEVGVHLAIIEFNDGPTGFYYVLKHFQIRPDIPKKDSYTEIEKRILKSCKAGIKSHGNRGKKLRRMKKGFLDSGEEEEGGESYVAVGF